MGEGGAVVTNSPQLYKILMSFRDWGRDCSCPTGHDGVCGKRFSRQMGNLPFGYDHKYTYSHLGYNLKITDWQASLGCAQLEKIEGFLKKRENNAKILTEKLSEYQKYLILPEIKEEVKPAWFGYLISVKETAPFTKQKIVEYLEKNGIGTRQLFAGNILRQPVFVDDDEIRFRVGNSKILSSKDLSPMVYSKLPNTEFIMNSTFWVGTFPKLGEEEMAKIADTIKKFIRENT